ncbi:hypothetical protein HNH97_16750, partial [Gluconacetobacter entanii]
MSGTTNTTVTARGMTVIVNGRTLKTYTMAECGRDLGDICGAFHVEYLDEVRAAQALGGDPPEWAAIRENDPVEIRIHGVTRLLGYVDDIQLEMSDGEIRATISGRDKTGDLVDASANPTGPGEYRSIHLVDVIGNLTGPFGLAVSADVDTGDPFTLVAVDPAEPAMSTIEKLSRQRGVLVTSDGVGGIILTQAGSTRAPGNLTLPGNVLRMESRVPAQSAGLLARRGWVGDICLPEGQRLGTRAWLEARGKQTEDTRARLAGYTAESVEPIA